MPALIEFIRDSYLVRNRIWSKSRTSSSPIFLAKQIIAYPPEAVLGPTLFSVPVEELFFFIVQTYIVSTAQLPRPDGRLTQPVDHVSAYPAE